MKLVVEDEKDTTCNGNGILDDQVKKMISSEPAKVSSNGDALNDDSVSNSESLNGSGDLLIEDPNVRNGSDDSPFQNGNKLDDTRSWSSNSSNFPPPDIDEDLSDEMTLRLSDEEDESENTTETSQNKKDNTSPQSSSPLPLADQNTLPDKNQLSKLIKEDKFLDTSFAKDDILSNNTTTLDKPSDNVTTNTTTKKTDETDKDKSPEMELLVPETSAAFQDTDKDKTVTELNKEMEELLNDDDCEDKTELNETDNIMEFKEEIDSDVDLLNSSNSTLNNSFSIDEVAPELKMEFETGFTATSNKEANQVTTSEENKEKTNEDEEIRGPTDDSNKKTDQLETEVASKLDKNIEEQPTTTTKSNETNEGSDNDVSIILIETPEESTMNSNEKTTSVEEKADSVSDSNTNKESKKDDSEPSTDKDDLLIDLKDKDENDKNSTEDKTNKIPEPMETEINNELKSSEISEAMEVDSTNSEKKTETPIEETTKNNSSPEITEVKKSDSLDDNKGVDEIKSETDIKEKDIKDQKEEESSKSLKRSLETDVTENDAKKPKITIKPKEKREYVPMNYFRGLLKKKEIKTMTREELEEFCVQKMCESINQSSKVGELSRLVKQQEQVIESLRTKYNGLKKQIGDISIVQNKMLQEVRAAKGKDGPTTVMPVKITRSVGLQVSLQQPNRMRQVPSSPDQLVAAAPMQKRKLQRISLPNKMPSALTPVTPITPAKPVSATVPRSPNVITTPTLATPIPTPTLTPIQGPNKIVKTILPRTYSVADANKDVTSSTNSLLGNYLTNPIPKSTPIPNIMRKTVTATNVVSSSAQSTPPAAGSAKVIDLTDEDDLAKSSPALPQTPAGIRVVASHQLTNNTSTSQVVTSQMQRVTYLVSPGQQGQVLLATTSAPTRPGGPRSAIMFKPVQQGHVPNGQRLNFVRPHNSGGTVTVLPATSTAPIRPGQQIRFQTSGTTVNSLRPQMISSTRITPTQRHPAPLPGPPAVQSSQPTWKAMPPKPSLKISRVGDGIVLSWKMLNKDMSLYEDIASYQLYAYQETNALPSTDMWRKVGDVKALALPMACTLTQFTDGNKYHFAVRAVDVKSRVGPFSQPEQIALP